MLSTFGGLLWRHTPVIEDRGETGQHVIHDPLGNGVDAPPVAGADIECAGLVASDHPGGSDAPSWRETAKPRLRAKLPPRVIGTTTGVPVSLLNGAGETISTGRAPCCSCPAVGSRLTSQISPRSTYRSSLPTGFASIQARSSADGLPASSHCANSSSSEYQGRVRG